MQDDFEHQINKETPDTKQSISKVETVLDEMLSNDDDPQQKILLLIKDVLALTRRNCSAVFTALRTGNTLLANAECVKGAIDKMQEINEWHEAQVEKHRAKFEAQMQDEFNKRRSLEKNLAEAQGDIRALQERLIDMPKQLAEGIRDSLQYEVEEKIKQQIAVELNRAKISEQQRDYDNRGLRSQDRACYDNKFTGRDMHNEYDNYYRRDPNYRNVSTNRSTNDEYDDRMLFTKDPIKRDYKLSKETQFEVWIDLLKSELRAKTLLDIVDPNQINDAKFSLQSQELRKSITRDLIFTRLDCSYQNKVLSETCPNKMLEKLKLIKNTEISYTPTSVLNEITSLRFKSGKQTAIEFNNKFDGLVSKHNSLPTAVKLEETRLSEIYYQAVFQECPIIQTMSWFKRQKNDVLKVDEMKMMLLQSQTNQGKETRETANRVSVTPTCYRCNEKGHIAKDCKVDATKFWCYNCDRLTNHRAHECRQTKTRGNEENQRYVKKRIVYKTKSKRLVHKSAQKRKLDKSKSNDVLEKKQKRSNEGQKKIYEETT